MAFQSTLPARGATDVYCEFSNKSGISIHAPRTGSDFLNQAGQPGGKNFNPRSPHGERQSARFCRANVVDFNPRSPHGERRGRRVQHLPFRQFQSTLPARGATPAASRAASRQQFQSTLPARGATHRRPPRNRDELHFNPRSPHGERRRTVTHKRRANDFNPRSPHGERPGPPRGGDERGGISIHAPRTGSDGPIRPAGQHHLISIHAPRTGSDFARCTQRLKRCRFQSTLPARGATRGAQRMRRPAWNFNPRSPHGERPRGCRKPVRRVDISIHAPRTGSDAAAASSTCHSDISIHAPRTGSDVGKDRRLRGVPYFNPRSPHGERPRRPDSRTPRKAISIHAPRTGSDGGSKHRPQHPDISIHAPRTGSDKIKPPGCVSAENFNPRSPHGERRPDAAKGRKRPRFQSTLPARGATLHSTRTPPRGDISIHAPRTGSDLAVLFCPCYKLISIHAPRTGSDSVSQ